MMALPQELLQRARAQEPNGIAASEAEPYGAKHSSCLPLTCQAMGGELSARLARPFKIIAFDWDGTAVMSRREDAALVRKSVEKLLRLGVSIVIVTATSFENIDQQLTSRIKGPHKGNLYVSTNRGSEVYGFDAQSCPVLLWQRLPTLEENHLLTEVADAACKALVDRSGLEIRVVYDRMNRRKLDLNPFPERHDPPKSAIGQVLQAVEARLQGAGLSRGLQDVLQLVEQTALERGLKGVRITSDAKQVEVGLTDKTEAMDWIMCELAQRLDIAAADILIAGDEFGPIAGCEGSDYRMVTLQTMEATFVSVGDEPGGAPPEVIHLGGGPATFRPLLAHQAARSEQLRRRPDSSQWRIPIGWTQGPGRGDWSQSAIRPMSRHPESIRTADFEKR